MGVQFSALNFCTWGFLGAKIPGLETLLLLLQYGSRQERASICIKEILGGRGLLVLPALRHVAVHWGVG